MRVEILGIAVIHFGEIRWDENFISDENGHFSNSNYGELVSLGEIRGREWGCEDGVPWIGKSSQHCIKLDADELMISNSIFIQIMLESLCLQRCTDGQTMLELLSP